MPAAGKYDGGCAGVLSSEWIDRHGRLGIGPRGQGELRFVEGMRIRDPAFWRDGRSRVSLGWLPDELLCEQALTSEGDAKREDEAGHHSLSQRHGYHRHYRG
jgi:hypothetical protein